MLRDKIVVTRVTVGYEPDYTLFERGNHFVEIRTGIHGEHIVYLAEQDFVDAIVALGLAPDVREHDREGRMTKAWLHAVATGAQADTSDAARKRFAKVWTAKHPE